MVFLPLGHLYNTEQDKNNHQYGAQQDATKRSGKLNNPSKARVFKRNKKPQEGPGFLIITATID